MNIDDSLLGPEIHRIVSYPYPGTKECYFEAIGEDPKGLLV